MKLEKNLSDLFGFNEKQIKETLSKKKTAEKIENIIKQALAFENISKGSIESKLLYKTAMQIPKTLSIQNQNVIVEYIMKKKMVSDNQLNAAFDYFQRKPFDSLLDSSQFEIEIGVGVEVSEEQIKEKVKKYFENEKEKIFSERYQYNFAQIIVNVFKDLKWADRKKIVSFVEEMKKLTLGSKSSSENVVLKGFLSNLHYFLSRKQVNLKEISNPNVNQETKTFSGCVAKFHKVGENYKTDGYVVTNNTMHLLNEHVKSVDGKVRTRFPPEPNGVLHIGHAKAMNLNFEYAKANNGHCILRYDDTNPSAEEERFFQEILLFYLMINTSNFLRTMVHWLGHTPWKITYTSDYFHELYDFAVQLIRRGLAYVDHQTAQEIYEERGGDQMGPRRESPYRNRPIEDNLRLLNEMKQGLWDEGTACLRMKQDMTDGNPQMWDLVAYRIKFIPHPKTGSEWCIYPSYDFSHCLIDSLENITHSLCTVEFKQSRISYYWLCNALDVYCPVQWEYSRLEVSNAVLSKRKILKLLEKKVVSDWDDPRLYTLSGLRRRGFPPQAINRFCDKIGITTAMGVVDDRLLDSCIRSYLNENAPRTMAILNPLKVTLIDYEKDVVIDIADFPILENSPTHKTSFGKIFFIEKDDFRLEYEKEYKRLGLHQSVGLCHIGFVISVTEVIYDNNGEVIELKAKHVHRDKVTVKPKAYIHWVADSLPAEVRWYSPLFPKSDTLGDNNNSLQVYSKVLIDKSMKDAQVFSTYQFERIGYFCVDPDSTQTKTIFNLTISLREDKSKIQ